MSDPLPTAPNAPADRAGKPRKHRPEHKFGIWPVIQSEADARWAIKEAAWAAVFCASATALFSVWSHFSADMASGTGLSLLGLIDAACFGVVAVGLFRRSRIAAVAGLLLYVAERLGASASANLNAIVMTVILVACYVSGIRGTFAYHRFRMQAGHDQYAPISP